MGWRAVPSRKSQTSSKAGLVGLPATPWAHGPAAGSAADGGGGVQASRTHREEQGGDRQEKPVIGTGGAISQPIKGRGRSQRLSGRTRVTGLVLQNEAEA